MRFFARRLFLLGAVFAALVMLMTPALAGADDDDDGGGGGGGGDRAYCEPAGNLVPGECSTVLGSITFDFDASSGPAGENPTGTFREVVGAGLPGALFWEIEVTCLQVVDNTAWIGGIVTDTNYKLPFLAVTVVDNGPGVADLYSASTDLPFQPDATTPDCGSVSPAVLPVDGDIVVQDDTAGGGGDDDDDDDDDD